MTPEAWALLALTVAAAALRFGTISSQSYWFDEALTAHELRLPFGAMLSSLTTHETNPPLYYVIGWLWARVFGTGEVSLRFISALAGTAVIPITYACGRELVSRRAGLLAAALAAVSPFMVWYSQEARSYMLLSALCGASLLFAARWRRRGSRVDLAWWAGASSLAVLTHFFAGFLILPEAVWLLWRDRAVFGGPAVDRRRDALIAVGCVAVVQAALLPLIIHDASHPISSWIAGFPRSIRLKQVPIQFAFGTLYRGSLVDYGWAVGIGTALVVGGMIAFGGSERERRGAAILAWLAGFVLIVPVLLALLGHDYIDARNLMPAWIPLAVLVGAACTAARLRVVGSALAAVLLGLFVIAGARVAQSPQYERPNWRAVASALGKPAGARAIVAYDGAFAAGPLAIYLRGVPWLPTEQPAAALSELDIVGSTWQTPTQPLPAGIRLLGSKAVDTMLVERFAVGPWLRLAPAAIAARATSLLVPAPPNPLVVIQRVSR